MADYRDYVGGNYLSAQEWAGRRPVRVTVEVVRPEQIKSDTGTDTKLVARFVGKEKGLSLNKTNMEMLAFLSNSTDYNQWTGIVCELYHDPDVKMGTKTVGGLRLRQAHAGTQTTAPVPPPTPPTPADVYEDDVPF